jgi:cell division protein FtsN
MLFGLGLGLVVALVVYLRGNGDPPARVAAERRAPPPAATAPTDRRGAVEVQVPAEARFDFYELLPQFEVVIPESEPDVRRDSAAKGVEQPGSYVVQVGSFATLTDADRMQANLALLGIESRIQRVTIDSDVYHRVRIGPINELNDLNGIRRRLRDARIESLLIKVSE